LKERELKRTASAFEGEEDEGYRSSLEGEEIGVALHPEGWHGYCIYIGCRHP
jgi:hypothetical protein